MCGIAAFFGLNAPVSTYRLLLELQHRGQESAGIAYVTGNDVRAFVRSGYVLTALNLDELRKLNSKVAIGHVRYSTSGDYMGSEGAQPIKVGEGSKSISVAFNGNIINYRELSKTYLGNELKSDSETLAKLIYELAGDLGDVVEAVKKLSEVVVGSYSFVVITAEPRVILGRDPHGFKPLAYAVNDDALIAASETSAVEALGFSGWKELRPGEIISYDGRSVESSSSDVSAAFTPCIFEYIYFSRPDSIFNGIQVHEARVRMGSYLGRHDKTEVDVVIPVPDSGRSAALGYSIAKGVRFDEGLFRNRYVGRSFIMPPGIREFISSVKYGLVKSVIDGRRVAVVDDSLIRGVTINEINRLLRCGGCSEVHVRIASPPIRYPCFMGTDFPNRRELIASKISGVESIAKAISADSVMYNTVDGLKWATNLTTPCLACFTGNYPFRDLDVEALEKVFTRG
ncbi:MAG: amidophosphoribosyltransferase [Sulfolobales archaeon]|nr:amidophosphoribosyltransferase [Sulfolobales archaeon]MCX8186358.1 amidophosphoribosyltransferase [Sulfolobales archaeon]MDW7968906.1 amidophosphoribosyltransferase [Sulfolobales archaeon]